MLLGTVRIIFGFLIFFFQCTNALAYICIANGKVNGGLVDCSGSSILEAHCIIGVNVFFFFFIYLLPFLPVLAKKYSLM